MESTLAGLWRMPTTRGSSNALPRSMARTITHSRWIAQPTRCALQQLAGAGRQNIPGGVRVGRMTYPNASSAPVRPQRWRRAHATQVTASVHQVTRASRARRALQALSRIWSGRLNASCARPQSIRVPWVAMHHRPACLVPKALCLPMAPLHYPTVPAKLGSQRGRMANHVSRARLENSRQMWARASAHSVHGANTLPCI